MGRSAEGGRGGPGSMAGEMARAKDDIVIGRLGMREMGKDRGAG